MQDESGRVTQAPFGVVRTTTWVDLNGDGLREAVVVDSEGAVRVHAFEGNMIVESTLRFGLAELGPTEQLSWTDVDEDGDQDFLHIASTGQGSLYLNDGEATFRRAGIGSGLPELTRLTSGKWVDVDGDDDLDLALRSDCAELVGINDGAGAFRMVELSTTTLPSAPNTAIASSGVSAAPALPSASTSTSPHLPKLTSTSGSITASAGIANEIDPCAGSIHDRAATGNSLLASSVPMLGRLYPMSAHWFLDAGMNRVGVGTTAPLAALDVAGTIRTRATGLVFPDGTTLDTASATGTPGPSSLWSANGNDVFYDTGNVGIGTGGVAPEAALEVSGGSVLVDRGTDPGNAIITLEGARPSKAIGTLAIRNWDGSQDRLVAAIRSEVGAVPDSGTLEFYTGNYNNVLPSLKINENGSTSFAGNLELATAPDGQTRKVTIEGSRAAETPPFGLLALANRDTSGSSTVYDGASIGAHRTSAGAGALVFSSTGSGSLREGMRLSSSGDLGIGVVAPGTRVDVDGVIRARGMGLEYPDGTTQSSAILPGVQHTTFGYGDFFSSNPDVSIQRFSGAMTFSSGATRLFAAVDIPEGAQITALTITGYDCSTTGAVEVRLRQKNLMSTGAQNHATTTLPQPTPCAVATGSTTLSHLVDMSQGPYFLEIRPTLWPGNGDLRVNSVTLEWQY